MNKNIFVSKLKFLGIITLFSVILFSVGYFLSASNPISSPNPNNNAIGELGLLTMIFSIVLFISGILTFLILLITERKKKIEDKKNTNGFWIGLFVASFLFFIVFSMIKNITTSIGGCIENCPLPTIADIMMSWIITLSQIGLIVSFFKIIISSILHLINRKKNNTQSNQ